MLQVGKPIKDTGRVLDKRRFSCAGGAHIVRLTLSTELEGNSALSEAVGGQELGSQLEDASFVSRNVTALRSSRSGSSSSR